MAYPFQVDSCSTCILNFKLVETTIQNSKQKIHTLHFTHKYYYIMYTINYKNTNIIYY